MAKTRRMMKANLKKEMKKHKIRKCSVKLTLLTTKSMNDSQIELQSSYLSMTNYKKFFTDNSAFRKALFRMHGIRDCTVKLHRLDNESFVVVSKPAKKKLLSTPKAKSVRFQVPWLPTIADVTLSSRIKETPKSAGKRSELSCDVTGCNDAINSPESSKPQKSKYILVNPSPNVCVISYDVI